ncbi:MAG TPA: radical SAM protein [Pyrinomonadaceae bacterium]|nr:radical SAM protein [Pyrinomonadaceae bacterium]
MIAPRPVHPADDPPLLSVELTNICNLHCSYCLRDDEALYHTPAHYFPPALLRRIIKEAREVYGITQVSFTGGEVTIHPDFKEIIEVVAAEGLKASFVTNGWHFDRVYRVLLANRETVGTIAFSIDGATREAHDRWRGTGSFDRVIRAVARCYLHRIPFSFKVAVRRDTVPCLEQIAMLGARLGAVGVHFSHLLPTSSVLEDEWALSPDERKSAEQEVIALSNIFKMQVGMCVGFEDLDPSPPCSFLRMTSCNVDYRGRLTLCCNLAGYRGAADESDVVADLTREDFAAGYARLRRLAEAQVERRRKALAALAESGQEVDIYTGSPCLFCLQSFGKIPWRAGDRAASRSLPVLAGIPVA